MANPGTITMTVTDTVSTRKWLVTASDTSLTTHDSVVVSIANSGLRWASHLSFYAADRDLGQVEQIVAALFPANSREGGLVQLAVRTEGTGRMRTMDVNMVPVLTPPWDISEFYIGSPDGQVLTRYTAVTRQSSKEPISKVFEALNPRSKWKGDMVVMRHVQGHVEELMNVGAEEIDLLATTIAAMGLN